MSTPNPVRKDMKVAAITVPERLMERMLEFEATSLPVLSLYLDGRIDEHGRRSFAPFVRKQITQLARTFPGQSSRRESVEADFVQIASYLEDDVQPNTQGISVFACAGTKLFAAGQFEAPFPRNQLFVAERPHLYPLARLIDQYRRYALVLADTNRAQIFVFAARKAIDRQAIENVKTKRAQIGGWSQSRYQRHLENYHLHHAKEVVEVLARTVREEEIDSIILAGDDATVIPLLRDQMSKELLEKVIDVLSLSVDTPEHELVNETLNAFHRHDSLTDQQKVEQLLNEYRRDGLAVAGVPLTLAALSNGQVEELLISASAAQLSFDETEVRKVLEVYNAGDPTPGKLDNNVVANELVRRAQQLSAAKITFVEDVKRLDGLGGVGALLRYRVSAETAAPYEQAGVVSRSEALIET